jgi:hypothetical protein
MVITYATVNKQAKKDKGRSYSKEAYEGMEVKPLAF